MSLTQHRKDLMLRRPLISLALIGTLGLAGCSAAPAAETPSPSVSATPTPTPEALTTGSQLTPAQALAALPTAEQIGAGYTATQSPVDQAAAAGLPEGVTVTPEGCMPSESDETPGVPAGATAAAEVANIYNAPSDPNDPTAGSATTVSVTSYDVALEPAGLDWVTDQIAKCGSFSMESQGVAFTGSMAPIDLPQYGDRTVGFEMKIDLQFAVMTLNMAVVYDGNNSFSVSRSSMGDTDPSQLTAALDALYANLDAAIKS